MNAELTNKTFLITGGAGFIGSAMCEKLHSAGASIICVDNLLTSTTDTIADLLNKERFTFIQEDVNNKDVVGRIFQNHTVDYVLHYAATVGVKRTLENPLQVLDDIEGIKNVLEFSRQHSVRKVIFASSSEVYGDSDEIPEQEEHTPLNVRFPYAAVKSVGENYFRAYWEEYGLPTTSLRFFNVYGPRQESSDYGFVAAIFTRQVLDGKQPTVFGDGSQTRDFTFIEDNLNATLAAFENGKANGEAINIGTGKETSILELAEIIIKAAGSNLKPAFLPPRENGDMDRRCPDITKMKEILGYVPRVSLKEGIEKTINWYRNQ